MLFSRATRFGAILLCGFGGVLTLQAEDFQSSEVTPAAYNEQNLPGEYSLQQISGTYHSSSSACCTSASGCGSVGCCGSADDGYFSFLSSDERLLSSLQDVSLGDCWTMSVGGQLRHRHMHEDDRLRPNGPDKSSYDLWRFNPYLKLNYSDWFTAHVEAIDASIFNEDMPALGIDHNRSDLLQAYADMKLLEADGDVRLRVGRQFLKYGSQHLVSPLAWSNTFRNFEGARLYYEGQEWNVDGFATQTVNAAAGNPFRPTSFDNPDENRWFNGVYTTYKGLSTGPVDFYWLWLRDDEPANDRLDGNRHTIGSRWEGKSPVKNCCGQIERTYIWDFEGGYQFGSDDFQGNQDLDVSAGFVSLMAGHVWNQATWTPTVKGVFYWASGDDDPNDGDMNTFSPLFPLGHAYWGILDNLNGSNLLDYSVQASVKPTKKLTLVTAMHWFEKDSGNDFTYNVAGAPLGPTGTDRSIGSELDFIGTYAINKNLSVQLGYSFFWYGDAVTQTALNRSDASQFYSMTTWKF